MPEKLNPGQQKKIEHRAALVAEVKDSSHVENYRPLLLKHARLVVKWTETSRKAAGDIMAAITPEQREMYREAVRLADECRTLYSEIAAMNLYPCPLHYLMQLELGS